MADAKVLVEFEVDAGGAIKAVRQFKKETGTIPESTEKARRGLINLRNVLAGLGAYFSIRTITQFGRAIIQTGAQFETMGIQLRAVTGSVEDANRAMDWITQFTADTPYQLEQVTGAFIKLRAMGLDPMDGTMQAVADMTSYLGGSMDVMNSIVLALGKSFTVGKMTMEEMRMLMERGVPVIDILADKLGVTNERILEMSQRGQLGRDAIGLLIEGMQELAGGASQRLMDSWAGLWSNLQDHITLALKELSEGGALDGAKEGLRSLVDGMKDLRESGRLQEWGADLGEMLAKTGEFIAKLIEDLPRVIEHATNLAKTFVLLFAAERVETFVKWVVKLRKEMVLTGTAAWGLHAALAAIVGLGLAEWFDTWNRKLEGPSARAIGAFQRAVKDAGMSVDGLLASFPEAVDKTEAWRMAFERFIRDTKGGSEATGQWVRVAALYNAEVKDAADVTVKASDAARDHADAIDGEALAVNAAADAVKKLISETKQATFEAEQLYFATDQLIRHLHAQEDAVETVAQSLDEFIQGMSMDWTMGLSGMEGPTSEWAEVTQTTFADLLGKGFVGELEKFSDLWNEIWQDLAKNMSRILMDELFGEGGGGIGGFFGNLEESATLRWGALLGGAGTAYSGYEQGGTGGIIQGMLGGAMAGAGLGTMLGGTVGSMAAGPFGAIVGALAGGMIAGLFGGGDTRPGSWVNIDTGRTALRDQDMSPEARQTWIQEQKSIRRDIIAGYREILGIFQDPELFDLIRAVPEFSTGGYMDISMDELGAWLRETYWPKEVGQMFRQAINMGLRQFGVDRETRRELWAELRDLPGADRMNALRDYIGAIVESSRLLADMEWQAILDVVSEDSMTAFLGGMADIQRQVLTRMAGLDEMSLVDRAREAQNILDLITAARQAEIQYLQQIQQMQENINRSIDMQIEQIRTGGMNENELRNFYSKKVIEYINMLRAGGIESPEALQFIMQELQRYIGLYAGALGENLYSTIPRTDQTYAEWLIGILEEAGGLSDVLFAGFRQDIEDANADLVEQLEILNGLLTTWNQSGGPTQNWELPPQEIDVTVDIKVSADQAWLTAFVDSRVDRRLDQSLNVVPY